MKYSYFTPILIQCAPKRCNMYPLCFSALEIGGGEKIIRNIELPSCRNCKFYSPSIYSDFSSSLGSCEKFGIKDIITDKITYDYADGCRNDESKCGLNARYFEEEPNLKFKMCKHSFTNKLHYYCLPLFVAIICWINLK